MDSMELSIECPRSDRLTYYVYIWKFLKRLMTALVGRSTAVLLVELPSRWQLRLHSVRFPQLSAPSKRP